MVLQHYSFVNQPVNTIITTWRCVPYHWKIQYWREHNRLLWKEAAHPCKLLKCRTLGAPSCGPHRIDIVQPPVSDLCMSMVPGRYQCQELAYIMLSWLMGSNHTDPIPFHTLWWYPPKRAGQQDKRMRRGAFYLDHLKFVNFKDRGIYDVQVHRFPGPLWNLRMFLILTHI